MMIPLVNRSMYCLIAYWTCYLIDVRIIADHSIYIINKSDYDDSISQYRQLLLHCILEILPNVCEDDLISLNLYNKYECP